MPQHGDYLVTILHGYSKVANINNCNFYAYFPWTQFTTAHLDTMYSITWTEWQSKLWLYNYTIKPDVEHSFFFI